jgi:excisionase family DNA binding protein
MPGAHFSDPESRQAGEWRFRQGGRRPIVARLRRANGRAYGRSDGSDLRSFAVLDSGQFQNSVGHFARFADIGGMKRSTAPTPTFFTERSLAAYLAVSDRTIRNWIRRGELPSYKLGASRRIDPADVDAFLEVRREEGP